MLEGEIIRSSCPFPSLREVSKLNLQGLHITTLSARGHPGGAAEIYYHI